MFLIGSNRFFGSYQKVSEVLKRSQSCSEFREGAENGSGRFAKVREHSSNVPPGSLSAAELRQDLLWSRVL